jgi:hypothetical protein
VQQSLKLLEGAGGGCVLLVEGAEGTLIDADAIVEGADAMISCVTMFYFYFMLVRQVYHNTTYQ